MVAVMKKVNKRNSIPIRSARIAGTEQLIFGDQWLHPPQGTLMLNVKGTARGMM